MKSFRQTDDPEAMSEAQKYEKPIPSRVMILEWLDQRGAPASREQLSEELGLFEDDQIEALRRRLRAMERDGQLIFTRRNAYAPVSKLNLVKGRVSGHKDGFGFLIPEAGGDDWFLSPAQMRLVFDGDVILAQLTGTDRRGRSEGSIVEVLERAHPILVGRYEMHEGIGRVRADNPRIQQEVLIAKDMAGNAETGQLVEVKITQWPNGRYLAQGEVIKVLGDYMAPGMEIELALRNYGIPHEWPADVLKETHIIEESVSTSDTKNRVDLRTLPLMTIDGEDARDFDDAVFAEKVKGGGWRLIVAIADVSHYVAIDSALDIEAQKRGNSVYFPDRVIPMLPEILSNGLCSLKPEVDRLALACEISFTKKGTVQSYRFFEAVIHSKARLTYTQANSILHPQDNLDSEALTQRFSQAVPTLQCLHQLYLQLLEERYKRGAIDFETQETRVIFTEDQKIEAIKPTHRNDAHRLIEECMLSANVAAADFLQQHKIPALYRVHNPPPEEKIFKLRQFLSEMGLQIGRGKASLRAQDFQKLMLDIEDRMDKHLIQTVMLRSMSQAQYMLENAGHFGLNYDAYTHFTSPIRRYPDLLVHRAIRSEIRSRNPSTFVISAGAKPIVKNKIYPYTDKALDALGVSCSVTERRADEATRDVMTWLKCEFMRTRVGEHFSGVITAVTGFGLFIELNDIYVEGLLHISALPGDYYHFDPIHHRLKGERTGRTFRLGDPIEIQLARVDLDDRKMDFELVGFTSKSHPSKNNMSKSKLAGKKKIASKNNVKSDQSLIVNIKKNKVPSIPKEKKSTAKHPVIKGEDAKPNASKPNASKPNASKPNASKPNTSKPKAAPKKSTLNSAAAKKKPSSIPIAHQTPIKVLATGKVESKSNTSQAISLKSGHADSSKPSKSQSGKNKSKNNQTSAKSSVLSSTGKLSLNSKVGSSVGEADNIKAEKKRVRKRS